jgi:hypothetical protein
MVKHVPALQESPEPRARPATVRGDVEVVVGEIADQEKGEEGLDIPRSQ